MQCVIFVCSIRIYCGCISETCKNCAGQILEGGGRILEGNGQLNYCQPVWAEPWILYKLQLGNQQIICFYRLPW